MARFVCGECGYEAVKWMGRCPSCGAWGSFREAVQEVEEPHRRGAVKPVRLSQVSSLRIPRYELSSPQLNRFFGGGVAKASVVLVSGEPGIGKSTLLLQLGALLGGSVGLLYASGEETEFQVADRAARLGVRDVWFVSTSSLEEALFAAEEASADVLVLDSVQTFGVADVPGVPGSPSQVRAVAERVVDWAKERGVVVFLVGHITKSGAIAGPKLLEHLVDVVVYLEGDRRSPLRVMKCVKNRFGPTDNVVLFEMTSRGLSEVEDPSRYFVDSYSLGLPGTVLSSVVEGSRAFTVEVQALVAPASHPGATRRVASYYDINRLYFLVAVMEKHLEMSFSGMDIYVNIPGGMLSRDTATDLAVVAAIFSSFVNKGVGKDTVVVGEVGLAGEVRWVRDLEVRLYEAASMGVRRALIPEAFRGKMDKDRLGEMELVAVRDVRGLMEVLFS